jgi:hypothetical protein
MARDIPRPPNSLITQSISKSAASIINKNSSFLSDSNLLNVQKNDFDPGQQFFSQIVDQSNDFFGSIPINVNQPEPYIESDSKTILNLQKKYTQFEDVTLDLVFDISGNDYNYEDPIQTLNDIVEVKNEINKNIFKEAEGVFKSVLKRINGYSFVKEKLDDKINNTLGKIESFEEGIIERRNTINELSISNKIKNNLIDSKESNDFNVITNFYINNYKTRSNTTDSQSKLYTGIDQKDPLSHLNININFEELAKYLMIDISILDNNPASLDFTNLVIQNLLNNVRSLYTLMPNCINDTGNLIPVSNAYSLEEQEDFIFLNESLNVNIWDNVETGKRLDWKSLYLSSASSDSKDYAIPKLISEYASSLGTIESLLSDSNALVLSATDSFIRSANDFLQSTDGFSQSSIGANLTSNNNSNIVSSLFTDNFIRSAGTSLTSNNNLIDNAAFNVNNISLSSANSISNALSNFLYVDNDVKIEKAKKIKEHIINYNLVLKNKFTILFQSLRSFLSNEKARLNNESSINPFTDKYSTEFDEQYIFDVNVNNWYSIIFNGFYSNYTHKSYSHSRQQVNWPYSLDTDVILQGLRQEIITTRSNEIADPLVEEWDKLTARYLDQGYSLQQANEKALEDLSQNSTYDLYFPESREAEIERLYNESLDEATTDAARYASVIEKINSTFNTINTSDLAFFVNIYYQYYSLFREHNDGIYQTVSSYSNFNNNEFKIKLDALVKEIKLGYLKRKNINIDLFNDIVKNIKNKNSNIKYKTKLSSFADDDKENIALLNANNDLYKLLFSDINDEEIQTNLSFSFNPRSVYDKKYVSVVEKSDNEEIANKILDVFSNYYPEGSFFSSTTLLKEIIEEGSNYLESFSTSRRSVDITNNEILYLSFFNNDLNPDSTVEEKNEVAKRFIFKAIQEDTVSSGSVKRSKIKKYVYNKNVFNDLESLVEKDLISLDKNSENYRESFDSVVTKLIIQKIDEYKQSSSSLKTIEDAVFGKKFLNKIKNEHNYASQLINRNLCLNIEQIFPFTHKFEKYNFSKRSSIEKKCSLKVKDSVLPRFDSDYEEKTFEINDVSLDKLYNGSILKKVNINKLTAKTRSKPSIESNKSNNRRRKERFKPRGPTHFNIEDKFEDCTKSGIFKHIIFKIKVMLRLLVNDYKDNNFNNELEIESFINKNSDIVDKTILLLELYSEIYRDIFKKLIFDFNMNLFSNMSSKFYSLIDMNSLDRDFYITNEKLIEIFNEKNTIFQVVLDTFNLKKSDATYLFNQFSNQDDSMTYSVSNGIKKYYEDLLKQFEEDNGIYKYDVVINEDPNNAVFFKETNEDVFCNKMYRVINSIKKSDLYQSLSFEITREAIKTIAQINDNIERVNNENLNNFSTNFGFEYQDFFKNIDNRYFRNIIRRNLNNVVNRNESLKENMSSILESNPEISLEEGLNNTKMFSLVEYENSYSKCNINDDIVYCFSLPYESLRYLSNDSLIKITIQPKDSKNTKRLYLPVIRYFTTNLISTNCNIKSLVSKESDFIYYENSKDQIINDAINGEYFSETNLAMRQYLEKVVEKKLLPNTDEQKANFIDNIIQSHIKSVEINKMLYSKHDINLNKFVFDNRQIFNTFLNSLSNNETKNIFGANKTEIDSEIMEFNKTYLMNESLNLLLSKDRDNKEVLDVNEYDKYLLSINKNDLMYQDIHLGNRYSIINETEFEKISVFNRTSLYEITNYQSNIHYQKFDRKDINEREFLTFIIKTEIL